MRTLLMTIWFIENNTLQFLQAILDALYKVLRDEDKSMKHEAFVCLELIGKLHTPDNYIPLVLTRSVTEDGERLGVEEKKSASDALERTEICRRAMTVFSTTANTTKVNILIAFKYLLMGTPELSEEQSYAIIHAVTSQDVIDVEAPAQLQALLSLIETLQRLFIKFDLVSKYKEGDTVSRKTLDFHLFFTLLDVQACVDIEVQTKANAVLAELSTSLTGTPGGLYLTHFLKSIEDKDNVPLAVFSKLLANGGPMLSKYTTDIVEIFLVHLHNV